MWQVLATTVKRIDVCRRSWQLLATLVFLNAPMTIAAQRQTQIADWTPQELRQLLSMTLSSLPARPADPSNSVERMPEAIALGFALFNDAKLSKDARTSCASCHKAARQFQDDRPLAVAAGTGVRRTMTILGAAHATWLFWDGRKDSLWSQALEPLEDRFEMASNRLRIVRYVSQQYSSGYESIFGPMPDLSGLPKNASPKGNHSERQAWLKLPATAREQIDRAFANIGKAIAAYEAALPLAESRFDLYVRSLTNSGTQPASATFSAVQVRGLKLFIGKGQCATCHNGPLFSDQMFHNTGVPVRKGLLPDAGRSTGVTKLLRDPFNCRGQFSDAQGRCDELRFVKSDGPELVGAFKTPGLRGIAERPPYMHAGQFGSLRRVVQHYARSPKAALGVSELHATATTQEGSRVRSSKNQVAEPREPHQDRYKHQHLKIDLSASEQAELVKFLATLSTINRSGRTAP